MSAMSWEPLKRAGSEHGMAHPDNGTPKLTRPCFYFHIQHGEFGGSLAGFVDTEEFDDLARRFGTPLLAEVRS